MKLCELRKEEVRLQTAISEEEGKIKAVHLELDSENSSLREERESLSRKEHELQSQQVHTLHYMYITVYTILLSIRVHFAAGSKCTYYNLHTLLMVHTAII